MAGGEAAGQFPARRDVPIPSGKGVSVQPKNGCVVHMFDDFAIAVADDLLSVRYHAALAIDCGQCLEVVRHDAVTIGLACVVVDVTESGIRNQG